MNFFQTYSRFLSDRLLELLEVSSSDILGSLLLGIPLEYGSEQLNKIKVTGMLFFFVISGMHLSILHALIYRMARALPLSQRAMRMMATCGTVLYAAVVGWSLPIIRTVVMKIYMTLGFMFRRLVSIRLVLFWLVVVYGFVSWLQHELVVFSPSFLLSYGAVFALLRMQQRKPPRSLYEYVVVSLQTSAHVNAVIAPILLFFFGEWNPVSLVFSLLFSPLISLIVSLGFIFLAWVSLSELVFSSSRGVATIFAPLFDVLLRGFQLLLELSVSFSVVVQFQPTVFLLFLYYFVLLVALPVFSSVIKRKNATDFL